jgi:hypothetical protein
MMRLSAIAILTEFQNPELGLANPMFAPAEKYKYWTSHCLLCPPKPRTLASFD